MNPHQFDNHRYRNLVCSSCHSPLRVPLSCGNRFCDICSGPRRRRVQAKIRALIAAVHPLPGERLRFMTLTVPNCEDVASQAKQLQRSFRRLRQRQWFRNKCSGGFAVLELAGVPGRWHLHLHCVVHARFLSVRDLSRHWRSVSTGRIVHIKTIHSSAVADYVTKYVCKSGLPVSAQFSASEALKGVRLYQPFGSWHSANLRIPRVLYHCPSCDSVAWALSDRDIHHLECRFVGTPSSRERARIVSARERAIERGLYKDAPSLRHQKSGIF